MNKVLATLLLMLPMCHLVFSQWNTSGANINNTNSGNVGIGTATATPLSKLQVVGEGTFGNNGYGMIRIGIDDGTNQWIKSVSGDRTLRFNSGNATYDMKPDGNFDWSSNGLTRMHLGSGTLGSTATNNTVLTKLATSGGSGGNLFVNTTWLYRDAAGSNWITARLHDGISIDNSYLTPGEDTRTWWERSPYQDVQAFGTGNLSYLVMKSGKIGLGTNNPTERLQVGDVATSTQNNIAVWSNAGAGGEHSKLSFKMTVGGGESNSTIAEIASHAFVSGALNRLDFRVGGWNNSNNVGDSKLVILSDGNVGIGTTEPDAKLAVKGHIHTQEVRVDLTGAMVPDYVFEENYNLLTIPELEMYITENKHLPEVPSAKQMEENGLFLKQMNLALLKKVEELTLYLIEQKKEIDKIKGEIDLLRNIVNKN